jgi:hypothetical protein
LQKVCDAVVTPAGLDSARFAGVVLEKLNGWEAYKRISDPAFHNVSYLRISYDFFIFL